MKRTCLWATMVFPALVFTHPASAQIERIWLTHRTNDPSKLVVNWTTKAPGDSKVRYGPTTAYGQEVHVPGKRTLHHVEIPLVTKDGLYHYSVATGEQTSPDAAFKGYPTDVLRVAVGANWQAKPDLKALLKDNPHLLLTAGDNIPDLWHECGAGVKDCTKPYAALIDAYPDLFQTVPFLPALGNHDREIRPRGPWGKKKGTFNISLRRESERPLGLPETGLEPALPIKATRPSTWRVCQFRHSGAEALSNL
jgi:hypothetical protein